MAVDSLTVFIGGPAVARLSRVTVVSGRQQLPFFA
jgi:hypothetical protein